MRKIIYILIGLIAFLSIAPAFAQQQSINIGTSANDHTGDPLRTAFQKVNANDAELYANVIATTTAGGTNTYTATPDPALTSLVHGRKLVVTFTNNNTGASTFNPNGLGAVAIKKYVSGALVDLAANDIADGQVFFLVYDGTNSCWQIHLGGGGTSLVGGSGTVVSGDSIHWNGEVLQDTELIINNGSTGSKKIKFIANATNFSQPRLSTFQFGNNGFSAEHNFYDEDDFTNDPILYNSSFSYNAVSLGYLSTREYQSTVKSFGLGFSPVTGFQMSYEHQMNSSGSYYMYMKELGFIFGTGSEDDPLAIINRDGITNGAAMKLWESTSGGLTTNHSNALAFDTDLSQPVFWNGSVWSPLRSGGFNGIDDFTTPGYHQLGGYMTKDTEFLFDNTYDLKFTGVDEYETSANSAKFTTPDFSIDGGFTMNGDMQFNPTGEFLINTVPGDAGDVFTSQGAGLPPIWAPPAGGGGGGSVTSFSAGDLSPLFTTSEATATTTPALTFSAVSQTQNLFFASPNGSSGNPSFRAVVAADIPTLNQNTTGSAATLTTGRTIALTGDVTYTSPSFNGSGNVTAAATVTRVNGVAFSGLATGILKNTTTTGVPSIAVAGDFPTLNQSTTGSAATLTTGRTIALTGDVTYTSPSFNGSGNVTAAATVTRVNGVAFSGLATGILKNTTTTGVPSIAVAGDFPTLNQNTTGSAATLTTGRTIALTGDVTYTSPSFNGSGNVTAAATIGNDRILESHLKAVNSPTDEYILTYEATTGDFEWQVGGGGGETNTASNLGGGLANYSTKVGVDLQFNSFNASNFDLASNLISLDYTNSQSASGSLKGFLTSTDWTTFDNSIDGSGTSTYAPYFNGTRSITGEPEYNYSSSTNTLSVDNLTSYTNQAAWITSKSGSVNYTNTALVLRSDISSTPLALTGTGLDFETETAASVFEVGSKIESIATNVGTGTESFDLVFKTMYNGATADEKLRILSTGDLSVGGSVGTARQVLTSNGSGTPPSWQNLPPKVFLVAVSDETTALTTGTAKITFRLPYAMTLTAVRASLNVAQASGTIVTVDINEAGTTILSTKLTLDNTETTSQSAATAYVISDTSLADDAIITIDIDALDGATAAKGLKITLIGY